MVALKDQQNKGRKSVWYDSRFYRVNLYWQDNDWRMRDIHLFNEKYPERYLEKPATSNNGIWDTLPVVDGAEWSGQGIVAGIRPVLIAADGTHQPLPCGEPTVVEDGPDSLVVEIPVQSGGLLKIHCQPEALRVEMSGSGAPQDWGMDLIWSKTRCPILSTLTRSPSNIGTMTLTTPCLLPKDLSPRIPGWPG